MPVYLIATLDTKGIEAAFVRDRLVQLGVDVRVIDTGCQGVPGFPADICRDEVFAAADANCQELAIAGDRGDAITLAARGAARLLRDRQAGGDVAGVIGLGGSAGTTIATAAMRVLPLGVPKVMVSTLASGQVRPYVGDKDICMLNAVTDIAGLNRISRAILGEAAAAMAGMVLFQQENAAGDRPVVVATMFGVTTPCVQRARQRLESAGYEVLVFHATGTGGQAMESLIADGLVAGVLDITTTELADELVGGVLSAGPLRLTSAAAAGVPQVVSVGALDMVNFGPRETIPDRFRERCFHQHNPTVTLMRTTSEENRQLGVELARKVAPSRGPAAILLPLAGVSAIDRAGQSFDDPQARQALFDAIREHAGPVPVIELPQHINDPEFADAAADKLLELMRQSTRQRR